MNDITLNFEEDSLNEKKSLRAMIAALAITVVAGAFVGCGSKQESRNTSKEIKK